jgi:hypothetical protein
MSLSSLSPAERIALAQLASETRWAKTPNRSDRVAATEPMRQAWLNKLADQADPDHLLSDDERMEAAKQLRLIHIRKMTAKSLATRRRRKAARKAEAKAALLREAAAAAEIRAAKLREEDGGAA